MSELEVDVLSLSLTFDFEAYFTDKTEGENDDKDGSDICRFFLKGSCTKGTDCPYKHIKAERAVVCKHWLRGLCKKGELCEFLHEYDLQKMPECYFFSKHGECNNQECMYLHVNPEEKVRECPWYSRGFCKHGPKCRHKHIKKLLCENYYLGFCPEGPKCKYGHPKYELPKEEPDTKPKVNIQEQSDVDQQLQQQQQQQMLQQQQQQFQQPYNSEFRPKYQPYNKSGGGGPPNQNGQQPPFSGGAPNGAENVFNPNKPIVCHKCGTPGHKSNACPNSDQYPSQYNKGGQQPNGIPGQPPFSGGYKPHFNNNNNNNIQQQQGGGPPMENVTCNKCSQTGHYANKCPNKKVGGYQGYQGFNNNMQQQNQHQQQHQGGGRQNMYYQQQQQNQQNQPPPQYYQQQQQQPQY